MLSIENNKSIVDASICHTINKENNFLRHFLFNTLKNENKKEFLTASTFCTFELIEEDVTRKRLSQDALF